MEISTPFLLTLATSCFSVGLAYLNYKAIKQELVGVIWHTVQFIALFILGFIQLSLFMDETLEIRILTLLLMASTHWMVFDTALNKFRGLDALYVGYTAFIDRSWRYLCEEVFGLSEANLRTLFMVLKIWLYFGLLFSVHYFLDN